MTQRCEVCGQSFGLTHSCPGALPPAEPSKWIAPAGLAPGFYFKLAIGVARLEDDAILEASRAPEAMLYGVLIWLIGAMLAFSVGVVAAAASGAPLNPAALVIGGLVVIVAGAILTIAQWGLCHLTAKLFFGATGTFLGVLQALLMGSIVSWLAWIPIAGSIISGIWSIAVLMRVFEEVDGVERMKAFLIAAFFGVVFFLLSLYLISLGR